MPENLADLLASRQEFLDLVKYLIELAKTDSEKLTSPYTLLGGKPLDETIRGRVLIDRFRCEVCHGRVDRDSSLLLNQAPNLVRSTAWLQPGYVEKFIANPHQVKPGTSMPQVMGRLSDKKRQSAAKAIAQYLNSLAKPLAEKVSTESLNAERGQELFHSVGCIACHSPRDGDGKELLEASSIPLRDLKAKYHLSGLVTFLKNPHAGAGPADECPI